MTDLPPRVLCTLCRNGLQIFYELLLDLVANSLRFTEESSGGGGDHRLRDIELRQEVEKRLIGDEEPPEYLTLLKKKYAVMSETAPKLGQVSFEQRWTQEQIVERRCLVLFPRKKWMSISFTTQHKQMVKNLYFPGFGDEGTQAASNAEPPAVDTTSIADEIKRGDSENLENPTVKVTCVVRNQTSNLTFSSSLKRHRTESTESRLKMDVLEGDIKYCESTKGVPGGKRQRCEFKDEGCQKSERLKPDEVDNSKDTVVKSVRNSSHETPAKC